MQRTHVVSSNLRSVGYNLGSQVLEIEFHSGSIYQYSRVPERVYTELMMAPSKGKYHHRYIRERYAYRQIW